MTLLTDFVQPGLGPGLPGDPSSGIGVVAFPVETFETQTLDLTVANLGLELIPARPGYVPVFVSSYFVITASSGTQTSPLVSQAGQDAAHTNFWASQNGLSNATVNAGTAPYASIGPMAAAAATVQRNKNATVILDVTTGAVGTGGFTLSGRFVVVVNFAATGGA